MVFFIKKSTGGNTMKKIYPIFLLFMGMCLYACPLNVASTGIATGTQIAMGFGQGMAALTYFAERDTELQEINKQLLIAGQPITIADTYRAAYDKNFYVVHTDGDTGQAFETMQQATQSFQKILKAANIPNSWDYILTSIDTAKGQMREGYTLFAVVYRPYRSITVVDKYDKKTIRTYTDKDRMYYEPYQYTSSGALLDNVTDWAGVPVKFTARQKDQAVMMTLGANKVKEGGYRTDYWEAENQWIAGNHLQVYNSQYTQIRSLMGM